MKFLTLTLFATLLATASFAGEKVTFIKGKPSLFKGNASFLLELDLSKTSIDALATEEAFIEYKKSKEGKDGATWETDWNNDKKSFLTSYTENLAHGTKGTQLKFSEDDPSSKYRMVLKPTHIETGNPVKYSSVEMKIHVFEMESNEEVTIIHVRAARGMQMGPLSPTVRMRVNAALYGSAKMLAKYIKSIK